MFEIRDHSFDTVSRIRYGRWITFFKEIDVLQEEVRKLLLRVTALEMYQDFGKIYSYWAVSNRSVRQHPVQRCLQKVGFEGFVVLQMELEEEFCYQIRISYFIC